MEDAGIADADASPRAPDIADPSLPGVDAKQPGIG